MKKLFVLPLLVLFIISHSQDSTRSSKTELGKIQIKLGTIIKKEYIDVYAEKHKLLGTSYNSYEIQVLNITDASTGLKISGLYISKSDEGSSTAFIDIDEIPGFIKFIEFLSRAQNEKPENYTEYEFNSKDLKLFGYYSQTGLGKKTPGWVYGIEVDKYYSKSTIYPDLKTLLEIKDAIINAKDKFSTPFVVPDLNKS